MISNADLLLHVASGKVVRPAYLDSAEYIFKIGLEMFEHIRARPANRYYDDIMIGMRFRSPCRAFRSAQHTPVNSHL